MLHKSEDPRTAPPLLRECARPRRGDTLEAALRCVLRCLRIWASSLLWATNFGFHFLDQLLLTLVAHTHMHTNDLTCSFIPAASGEAAAWLCPGLLSPHPGPGNIDAWHTGRGRLL